MQHLEFATKGEGMTANISAHAAPVSSSLADVARLTDQAIAIAQKTRAATDAAEATKLVAELDKQMSDAARLDMDIRASLASIGLTGSTASEGA